MEVDKEMLESIVRQVVAQHFGKAKPDFETTVDSKSGVIAIKTATVQPEKFDTGKPGDKVYLKDVLTLEQSPRLGCGVMEMTTSSFEWFLKYDEVDIVLEGSLSIVIEDRTVTANKGDIILIPKNTAIQFSVPEFARFVYVTYPANWEGL